MDLDDASAIAGGMYGGLIRWLRSPDGRRGLALALASGSAFGFTAAVWVRYQWPDIPADVRTGLAVVVGVVSSTATELLFLLANLASSRAVQSAREKIGATSNNGTAHPAGGQSAESGSGGQKG